MLMKDRRPQVVGICWSEVNGIGSTELEQRVDDTVEVLRLAHDAADVLLDDGILGDTIAKQSRRRRDGEHWTPQLVSERGCYVLSDLHALRIHAGYYVSAARRKAAVELGSEKTAARRACRT